MRALPISVLLLGLVIGCESYPNYPNMSTKGKLYLECFPCSGTDSTILTVSRARPVNQSKRETSWDDVLFELNVNGSPINWESCKNTSNGLRYSASTDLTRGDIVALTVHDSDNIVHVESSVPESPAFTYSREMTQEWLERYHIILETTPFAGGAQFYGAFLEARNHYLTKYPDGRTEEEYIPISVEIEISETAKGTSFSELVEERFHRISAAGKEMFVFSLGKDDPSPYEFDIMTASTHEIVEWPHPDAPTYRNTQFRLVVYKLNQRAYRFLSDLDNPVMIGAGLVPPFVANGNMKDIYGMFESLGQSSTEWLPALIVYKE